MPRLLSYHVTRQGVQGREAAPRKAVADAINSSNIRDSPTTPLTASARTVARSEWREQPVPTLRRWPYHRSLYNNNKHLFFFLFFFFFTPSFVWFHSLKFSLSPADCPSLFFFFFFCFCFFFFFFYLYPSLSLSTALILVNIRKRL